MIFRVWLHVAGRFWRARAMRALRQHYRWEARAEKFFRRLRELGRE